MNQQRALIILLLVASLIFLLAFFYTRDAKKDRGLPANSPTTEFPTKGELMVTILKRTYEAGTHAWEGSVILPTPCHRLEAPSITVAESYPEQVHISLVSQAPAGACAEVRAEKIFTVSFQASQDAIVSITLDGQPLSLVFADTNLNAKPLSEGEAPSLVQ